MQYSPAPRKKYYKPEFKKYRVRTAIKSFRDLEVYQKTTQLASDIFKLKLPKELQEEHRELAKLAQSPPRLISASYGEKFVDITKGLGKLEEASQVIANIISRLDFLVAASENADTKESLVKFLHQYQIQKRKILNLKRAWENAFLPKKGPTQLDVI